MSAAPLPVDFSTSPLLVFYEVTRSCDLACQHCRACAQPRAHPNELSHDMSVKLLKDLASFPRPPLLVFTGGDPFKRADLFDLTRLAIELGLTVAVTPSATPLVTREKIEQLKGTGIHRMAVSLDGADAATHDSFRGVSGSFQRTMDILRDCKEVNLSVQVNTTITRRNIHQVDQMAELLAQWDIAMWSVFFLVPVGRGLMEQRITPDEYEQVFEQLWQQGRKQNYAIKTTEAPHYRRFALRRSENNPEGDGPRRGIPTMGTNDGNGVIFVSHTGQVFPSGFMPIECGRFPDESVVSIYQNAPMLRLLRDHDQLKGKCGMCDFRQICGGSRARAYALTRDPMASDPDCAFFGADACESAAEPAGVLH